MKIDRLWAFAGLTAQLALEKLKHLDPELATAARPSFWRPPPGYAPIRDYCFDRERLKQLDDNRRTVVHGGLISAPLPDGDAGTLKE